MSFVNLSKGRILDIVMERIRKEGRGGELWTAPTKEMKSPSKKRRTGSASSMDMKGGRTQREESHKERKHTKGGGTRREGGHKGREDTKRGRRGRGTMDCPNKRELIAE